MTYLELVNDVLVRLREPVVTTVSETTYSALIGKFVNDAKRQIEDAFAWNVLGQTLTVTTASGTASYSLTGSGQKFQVTNVLNTTSNITMRNISTADMNRKQNFTPTVNTVPTEFAFDGVDGSYDTKVTVYPKPDGVYTLKFFMTIPQATLSSDNTVVLVPDVLIVQNAYARALVERGEDGGLSSSEAYALYRSMLSDYIALEGTRFPDNDGFDAV
jgi:asparagine N-glycosylation enzyme membrane subunit Stt3